MEATSEVTCNVTVFLARVCRHLRSLPDRDNQDRQRLRGELVTLFSQLNVSPEGPGPLYDEMVADDIREWLDTIGERNNYELSANFEVFLETIEGRAQARRNHEAQRRENVEVAVAEAVFEPGSRGWEEAAAVGLDNGHENEDGNGARAENEWVVIAKGEDEAEAEEEKAEWELVDQLAVHLRATP